MIIARLQGGLGNQFFQYAWGGALARARGAEFKLDVTELEKPGAPRAFALDAFNIRAGLATTEETQRLRRQPSFWERAIGKSGSWVREREPHQFDEELLRLPDGVYLDGYWQSPGYMDFARLVIKEELAWKQAPSARDQSLLDEMHRAPSVAVHVRRGDFLANPEYRRVHGVLEAGYYREAVTRLDGLLQIPANIFVFSDDPDWVHARLDLGRSFKVVDHHGPHEAAEDLRLMAHCRHQIIANSSLSWLAAWLNANPQKIVFAPRCWYADGSPEGDLIPTDWIRG